MQKLSFDIETIPQELDELSSIQMEELEKKVSRAVDKGDSTPREELVNRICSTSPYLGKIVCIGLFMEEEGETESLSLIGSEKEILERFWKIVGRFDGLFISYNGREFDVPFIVKRSMHYNMSVTNFNFLKTKRFSSFPHFDVKDMISDWNSFSAPTLKLACDLLGVPSPKEGEVKAENVYAAFKEGRIQEIADYCVRDVVSTFKCYERILPFMV